MKENKDKIVIEFTEELLEEWTKLYFKKHPRARKKPIEHAQNPSLNKWIILRRLSMNKLKQDFKDFTKFVVHYYGLEDLSISKCKCNYITYRENRRRIDLDNTTPKFLLDGLTAECTGVLVDDGIDCITSLTLLSEYKGHYGSRIEFYDCEYNKELMLKTREKENIKSDKRSKTIENNKNKKKVKRNKKK